MKVTRTVRRLYDDQLAVNQRLQTRVREVFTASKPEAWFYRDRIKSLESFAQKLETGRGGDPAAQEDFFGCMLVVENRSAIEDATRFVERFCEVLRQRPEIPGETHKRPEAFPFDDLRLYVHLKSIREGEPIDAVPFEVQVKTFLQYAWGIATHDLIYKGEQINWGTARVAYQIKAMLEHAEISIAEVEIVAKSAALAVTDRDTRLKNKMLSWFHDRWLPEQLPADRRRLVDTMVQLVAAMRLDVDDLISAVEKDTQHGEGRRLHDLSPYGIALRALFKHHRLEMERFLRDRHPPVRLRLFVTEEMELGEMPSGARPERIYQVAAGAARTDASSRNATT